MSELTTTTTTTTNRHCWSWKSCFTNAKHNNKKKTKKKQNHHQSNSENSSSNGHICNKPFPTTDENCNILNEFYLSSNDDQNFQPINEDSNSKLINPKSSSTVKVTQLDAIVEDINEENFDDINDKVQPVRLYNDQELINNSNDLYSRLFNLIKMNHIIKQFNDHGYFLYNDFTHQLEKLKLKIYDIKRTSSEIPYDAELLEARYSTLLATIESLSLLLKITQISSTNSLLNCLILSIEQRIEQLNKLVQLTINARQQRRDITDDDFLSFRSAFSSYEHLLTMSS